MSEPLLIRPSAILFSCTFNSVRSPIAEGLTRLYFGRDLYVASAGVKHGEDLDPFAIAVMDEVGVDLHRHHPHTFEELEDDSFDLIVTLSPEAHHKALEFTRTLACDVTYWPTVDPTAVEGSRDRRLEAYRDVRDGLSRRIKALLDYRRPVNVP
jgi:protein-tyrosine-phosphatase